MSSPCLSSVSWVELSPPLRPAFPLPLFLCLCVHVSVILRLLACALSLSVRVHACARACVCAYALPGGGSVSALEEGAGVLGTLRIRGLFLAGCCVPSLGRLLQQPGELPGRKSCLFWPGRCVQVILEEHDWNTQPALHLSTDLATELCSDTSAQRSWGYGKRGEFTVISHGESEEGFVSRLGLTILKPQ